MAYQFLLICLLWTCSTLSFAVDMVYCPQKQGYIKLGMSAAEVVQACGEPMTKQDVDEPVTEKVPMTQLYYSTPSGDNEVVDSFRPIYDTWSLPEGTLSVMMEVDIINDKVSSIRINGDNTNALSICDGQSIAIGDNAMKVYQSCGTPQTVNQTFIEQPIPSNSQPQVWIYQVDPYQPPISLTIVDGKLQSIN